MCQLYADLQRVASWIANGNDYFINACVIECDATIKAMLDEGKQAEVKETLRLAVQRMPKEMGAYIARSCIGRGVTL